MNLYLPILVLFFTFYTYYPGQSSIDTFIQLKQARIGIYSDWQPPIISYLFHFFPDATSATGTFIFLQILCFVFGSYLLYLTWKSGKKTDYIFLLIPLLPPVFTLVGVVWKDIFFAALLFLCFSFAEYFKTHPLKANVYKYLFTLFFLGILAIAQMFRTNGMFFTLFICSHLLKIIWFPQISKKTIYTLALIHMFSTLWFTQYFNYTLLKAEKTRPLQYTMFYDLVGISYFSKYNYIPAFAMPTNCETYKLTEIYDYHGGDNLFADTYYNKNECKLHWVRDNIEYTELQKTWLNAIRNDFISYIQHRIYFFGSFLKLDSLKPNVAIYVNTEPNEFGINYDFNIIRKAVIGIYYGLTVNPFFYPWFYFLILILSQIKNLTYKPEIDFDVFAGCILYMLGFAAFGPGQVYRYTYPVAVILTAILTKHFVNWLNSRKRL